MRSIILALTFFISLVAANSGIFGDNGQVLSSPGVARDVVDDVAALQPQLLPLATPTKRQDTNAYRLKRGMHLVPPSRRTRGDALYPRASCVPLTSNTGVISVTKLSTGTLLGYIRKTFDNQKSYTYGPIDNALTVALPSSSPFGSAFDITAVNGPDPSHPLVGAVGGSGGYDFTKDGYAYLAGTGHTNANSPPSTVGHSIQSLGYDAPSESQFWSIDCLTLQLSAQWTNVDGSQPPTSLFYDTAVDFLGLVGDIGKFDSKFPGEGTSLVGFTFVPI